MTRKKKPDLVLTVDFGGSGTKAFYGLPEGDGVVGSVLMAPEVAKVPKSAIESFESRKFASGLPENEAWIGVDDEYAAVGYLATSELSGISHLAALKYEQAVMKFLAVVWTIYKRMPQLGTKFRVMATVLLPGGEYADRTRLNRDLQAALASFKTPDGEFGVEMLSFNCLPEGAGIYSGYREQAGESFLKERIGFLMLGYRNASFLLSDRGSVRNISQQSDLGMVRMIERVQQRTSGLDASRLAAVIVQAGDRVERAPLWKVCRSPDPDRRHEEAERLEKAIKKAREEYIAMLWNWIDEVLPKPIDRLVFSGGTADYLRKEIESFYTVTPLEFHGGLVVPSQYCPFEAKNRFVDVWAAFLALLGKLSKDYGVEMQLSSAPQEAERA